jgi:predicted CXXCH cytochrome family protein
MRPLALMVMMTCLLQTSATRTVAMVEILTPPEHTCTDMDHLYIVGRTDAPIVEIHVNGDLVQSVPAKDSVFHALLWFGYGLNEITVASVPVDPEGGPGDDETVEVLIGPRIDDKYEYLFTPYKFHNSAAKEDCIGCHRWESDDQAPVDDAELCYQCHRVIRERFKNHIPDNSRACIDCHRLRNDLTVVSFGVPADLNPCYRCHEDKIGAYAQEYIHGPVAGGSCTVCHDPHGSVFENSLVSPVAVLCPSCHTQIGAKHQATEHPPFANGRCTVCHDPHSTNNRWVLVQKSQELCMNCHRRIGTLKIHDHPYNVEPKRRLAKPLKLTTKGKLECLSCHEPHQANTEHL